MATKKTGGTNAGGSKSTAGNTKQSGKTTGATGSTTQAAGSTTAETAKATTGNTAKAPAKKTAGAKGGAKKTSGAASKGATKTATSKTGGAGSKAAAGGTKSKAAAKSTADGRSDAGVSNKLRKDLREFVQAHPGGWGHNEWIGLVNILRDRGHDTSDTDAIGMALERERLTLVLERVPGLGPAKVKSLADKYPRLWNLMQAGAEEIAAVANLPKSVAEKVRETLR